MITVRPFGESPYGEETQLFIIENGTSVLYVTDYGARIVALSVADKNGYPTDVVLGFDNASDYAKEDSFGTTVGRFANRIEKGKFTLNGKEYTLAVNNGPNHLHGGLRGFSKRVFKAFANGNSITFEYDSPDGEEGYPGTVNFSVRYTLKDDNTVVIDYTAVTDADTVVNFTNHSYFNLDGTLGNTDIGNHYLYVNASAFCETDGDCLANGTILPVRNTAMDFTVPKAIGTAIHSDYYAIKSAKGIDHNFVLGFDRGVFRKAAELYSEKTGILLECYTDQPGIQIYTGNHLNDSVLGKFGTPLTKHGGVCLETQGFPNSTSFSYFPSPVLKKGDTFNSRTEFRFGIK